MSRILNHFLEDMAHLTHQELSLAWSLANIATSGDALVRVPENYDRAVPPPIYIRQARAILNSPRNAGVVSGYTLPVIAEAVINDILANAARQ